MTWFRVDDQLADHPKVMALGDDRLSALGLWTMCGTYCAKHLTDGFVPEAVARMYSGSKWARLIPALVRVGLLESVEGGYRLHDYHDYNPSRQHVSTERAKKRAAGQAGGQASAQARAEASAEHAGSEAPQPRTRTQPVPVPMNPFEYQEPREVYLKRTRRKRLSQKEADWLEDMHASHSRTELCHALLAVEPGTDYLNRVKAYLNGRAA